VNAGTQQFTSSLTTTCLTSNAPHPACTSESADSEIGTQHTALAVRSVTLHAQAHVVTFSHPEVQTGYMVHVTDGATLRVRVGEFKANEPSG
jgi:hypothetical protein